MLIRPIKKNEIILLTDFIYESIFQTDTLHPAPRTTIQEPAIWLYIDAFGSKQDDCCFVAEINSKIIGAVWVRCIRGFGYIADDVPEFAIAVYPEYRGMGVGTQLMKTMLENLRVADYERASLSVQKENKALQLYRRLGFEVYAEDEHEYILHYILQCDTE